MDACFFNHSFTFHRIVILLANCRKLGGSRLLSRGNQPGEARSGRAGMSGFCEPSTSTKDVHSCCGKQSLKPELLASYVACAAHLTGSHALSNCALNPS